jgi:hypothetical protein
MKKSKYPSFREYVETIRKHYRTNKSFEFGDFQEALLQYIYATRDKNYESAEKPLDLYFSYKDNEETIEAIEEFKGFYDETISHIKDAIDNGSPLWREVCVDDYDRFRDELFAKGKTTRTDGFEEGLQGVGTAWSWEKEGAKGYNAIEGEECLRMASRIENKDDINFLLTTIFNFQTNTKEREIRLNRNRKIQLLQICKADKNGNYRDKNCETYKVFANNENIQSEKLFYKKIDVFT